MLSRSALAVFGAPAEYGGLGTVSLSGWSVVRAASRVLERAQHGVEVE
jgi:hypothetical protein